MIDNSKVSNIPCRLHNVGEGGVAGADEVIDDLKGKTQQQINAEVEQTLGDGGSVDERIAAAVTPKANSADVYAKTETYTKEEVHNLITTPNQEYVSVVATDQTTAVTDVLPATGEADTIYRVGNWDGTQYNDSVFSEYAWNGSAYVKLSTKSQIGEVYDISANHADTKYADLAAALGSNGANVPQSLRKGGMSVKFVQTSDNNYVQFRCMAQSFTTDVTQWRGADGEPNIEHTENTLLEGDEIVITDDNNNERAVINKDKSYFKDLKYDDNGEEKDVAEEINNIRNDETTTKLEESVEFETESGKKPLIVQNEGISTPKLIITDEYGLDIKSPEILKGKNLRFAVITDNHFTSNNVYTLDGLTNLQLTQFMIDTLIGINNSYPLDFILHSGDVFSAGGTLDNRDNYPEIFKRDYLGQFPAPLFPCVGNHDAYNAAIWEDTFGKKKQYSIETNCFYIIVLDVYRDEVLYHVSYNAETHTEDTTSPIGGFKYSGIDWEFLEVECEKATKLKKPIIICLHTLKGTNTAYSKSDWHTSTSFFNDKDKLMRFYTKYNIVLRIYGHSHIFDFTKYWDPIYTLNAGWFAQRDAVYIYNNHTDRQDGYTAMGKTPWSVSVIEVNNGAVTHKRFIPAMDYFQTGIECDFSGAIHDNNGNVEASVTDTTFVPKCTESISGDYQI